VTRILAILVLLLSAAPAVAAEQWTSRQLGGTRYSDFRSEDGKIRHCQTRRLGSQTTTTCR